MVGVWVLILLLIELGVDGFLFTLFIHLFSFCNLKGLFSVYSSLLRVCEKKKNKKKKKNGEKKKKKWLVFGC